MLLLARLLICGALGAAVRCVPLDEVPESELLEALLARSFPLRRDAVSWESVAWTNYSKIIISGPQRSGTTFFATALAKYLGYLHVDEKLRIVVPLNDTARPLIINGMHDQTTIVTRLLKMPERMVLQRPTWSHKLHTLPPSADIFIAFVSRNCLDVYRSQNRVTFPTDEPGVDTGWTCKFGRTVEWRHYHEDPKLLGVIDSEHDMICTMKQQAYKRFQRRVLDSRGIANAPIAYGSFKSLGAFREAKMRQHLGMKEIAERRRTGAAVQQQQRRRRRRRLQTTPRHQPVPNENGAGSAQQQIARLQRQVRQLEAEQHEARVTIRQLEAEQMTMVREEPL